MPWKTVNVKQKPKEKDKGFGKIMSEELREAVERLETVCNTAKQVLSSRPKKKNSTDNWLREIDRVVNDIIDECLLALVKRDQVLFEIIQVENMKKILCPKCHNANMPITCNCKFYDNMVAINNLIRERIGGKK